MTKPTVLSHMTASPHTVGVEQTVAHAHELMRSYRIRHLPVLRGGELVGIVTDRDLALVQMLAGVDPQVVTIEEAMSSEVFTVSPQARLDTVVREMARKKYGSAVVVQGGKVAGIFTMVDACRALAQLLDA